MKKELTKFIDEIVLGLFGVIVVLFNYINAGSLEVTVVGGLMILAAVLDAVIEIVDNKPAAKKTTKK